MSRIRIIYARDTGKKIAEFTNGDLTWSAPEYSEQQSAGAPMVMGDIQPYQSQIDGSMISSRSQHRSHLRQHGCVEVGNETKTLMSRVKPMQSPPGLKQTLVDIVNSKLR